MKTLILYCSKSNGNTKKLVDAIVAEHPEVDTIDATTLPKDATVDFSQYHLIGLASGIYYGKFDKSVSRVAEASMRDGDFVFGLMTYGADMGEYTQDLADMCRRKQATLLGVYGCRGYSDFALLKPAAAGLRDHPNEKDIQGAVDYFNEIEEKYDAFLVDQRELRDKRDAYDAAHKVDPVQSVKQLGRNISNKVKSWTSKKE